MPDAPASISDALFTGETSDHVVTLRNDGVGTLDFTIPTPEVSTPLSIHPALPAAGSFGGMDAPVDVAKDRRMVG